MPTVTVGTGKTYISPQAAWDDLSGTEQGGTITVECDAEDYPILNVTTDSVNPFIFTGLTTYDFTAATEDVLPRINRVIIDAAVTNSLTINDISIYSSNVFLTPWTCGANNARFNRLIIQQTAANNPSVSNTTAMANTIYEGCVFLDGVDVVSSGFAAGAKKIHCLIAGGSDKGIEGSGGLGVNIADRCFSFNNGGLDYDTGQIDIIMSASEDTTGTYTGYTSAECVDFAGRNYLLKSTSALATIAGGDYVGVGVEASGGVTVNPTLGTIEYTSNDSVVTISGSIDITSTLGAINYESSDTTIGLTGSVDVIATLGTISYSSNNVTIQVAGEENLTATLGTIEYSSNEATIDLTGSVDLIVTLGAINYTSNDAVVTLQGQVDVITTLGAISYESNDVNISIGEGQVIGAVATSFKSDLYASSFKDDLYITGFKDSEITVNFKS